VLVVSRYVGDRQMVLTIIDYSRRNISEIKLKRTDTTLDLSQKAKRAKEKTSGREGKIGS